MRKRSKISRISDVIKEWVKKSDEDNIWITINSK